MAIPNNAEPKKKSWRKRLLRFFLWSTGLFLLLIVGTYIFIRIQYPPEKIRQLVADNASKALNNRHVSISDAKLNVLEGFVFDGITVYQYPLGDPAFSDTSILLSVDRAVLKYKLSSLLRRKLEINEVTINRPTISFSVLQNQKTSIDDLLAPSDTSHAVTATPAESDTTIAAFSLPVAFELDKFDFRDFTATLKLVSDDTELRATLRNFSILIDDLYIPKGSLDAIRKQARANLRILTPSSSWNAWLRSPALTYPMKFDTKFEIDIGIKANGFSDVGVHGNIQIGQVTLTEMQPRPITYKLPAQQLAAIETDVHLDGDAGKLNIGRFFTSIIDQPVLTVTGTVDSIFTTPECALQLKDSRIDIKQILNATRAMLPSDYRHIVEGIDARGILSIHDTAIQGQPLSSDSSNGIHFRTGMTLTNLHAVYDVAPKTEIDSLTVDVTTSGTFYGGGLTHLRIAGQIGLNDLTIALTDTTELALHKFQLTLSAALSDSFIPERLNLTASIERLFDGSFSMDATFASTEALEHYKAKGNIQLNNLVLQQLPGRPLEGRVSSRIMLSSNSLDDIGARFIINTDSLTVPSAAPPLTIAPLQSKGNLLIGTNNQFTAFNLKSLSLNVNDFMQLATHGNFENSKIPSFNMILDSARLSHEHAFAFLPKSLKAGIEHVYVGGKTVITASGKGTLPPGQNPVIEANVDGHMEINASDPTQGIHLHESSIEFHAASDLTSASATVEARLGSLSPGPIRRDPIRNTSLIAHLRLPTFEQIKLDSLIVRVPDIGTTINATSTIDHLSTQPVATSDVSLSIQAPDKLMLVNDISILGSVRGNIELNFNSPIAAVSGILEFKNLNLWLNDEIDVKGFNGQIPFSQQVDIERKELVKPTQLFTSRRSTTWDAINYGLFRPYYQDISTTSGSIQVEQVRMLTNTLSDIAMDISLGNGQLYIPHISLFIFDGNMTGYVDIDLGSGKLDEIEYFVKADMTQLNSAEIVPQAHLPKKDSELNLNFQIAGKGLNIDNPTDLQYGASLYITKIGSKFTDNALRSLDPQGSDKSIQSVLRFLNWGYKPRLITVEVKHGNIYPTIHLVRGSLKAYLIPIKIRGNKIEMARIPIEFFLQSQLSSRK
ncbi:hypothetical protein JW960_17550 [candidate division KSB1 bacterium]|nr:hypothetical protein [candidate division KSB1 bacterium]